ncbi:MAG: PIN domain-containing protein [Acidobacteria bacterium]|nr:PIN domain-containing protein [Acidobacteriota bacterium]
MRFVDTSFWIALRFRRDERHPDARSLWEAGTGSLLTSDLILGETWTFLRRRAGHRHALEFLEAAASLPALTVRHVDEDLVSEAWRWLRRHDERPYSFVDATSFATMRRLRLREALAFDGDFAAAGFVEVRPPPKR